MNKTTLFLICLCLTQFLNGQSFQEICESSITNGTIVDCQMYGDTLYATGFFNTICGESVGYIAKWENDEWNPSAINISDPGHSLTVIDDVLYIAKYEEGIDSNWVYTYNGAMLNNVGEGVYLTTASGYSELPNIYDVIEYDGQLIACGEFDRVGAEAIQGIMRWNGTNWEAMGTGINSNIQGTAPVMFPHQMIVHNSELYVVGNFRNAGGIEVNGIAKWNGTQWSSMGTGFNGTVYSIAVFNNEIIVGGSFTESNGMSLNRIAKWNGTNWEALNFGFTQPTNNDFIFVHTLKVIDDILFIGGGLKEITYADNTTEVCNGIISYSNTSINTFMGGVPNNDIEAICKIGTGQLLVGGGVFGNGYSGITDLNVNTAESNPVADIYLTPNPFTESITISSDMNIERFEVLNQIGQIVCHGEFEKTLHLNLLVGVYFLRLFSNQNVKTIHKVVKI